MRAKEGQNETALVIAARRGDKEAMRKLLELNWGWLKGLVYSVVCDVDALDDILQDVCLRVIDKISSLREPERFRAWLAVIAKRQALHHRIKRREHKRLGSEKAVEVCDERSEKLFESIEYAEECQKLLAEVNSLPDKYRDVFMLAYSGDLTYRQMAEILDVPMTTMQIRLVRARRMILERVTGKDKGKVQGN
ncbi:MAG: RNA polymerase sigma factor [Planctomycetota bacterium]|jgi:RNA polymerase sigma-70 factor (ECF subfamily)